MAKIQAGTSSLGFKIAAYWKDQIESIDKAQTKWYNRGMTILKRFRDERGRYSDQDNQRKMNLLWTNIKIMKPALLSRCPIPCAERKFLDRDPIARLSASMLQRSLRTEIEDNGYYESLNRAVLDYLLPGRGQVWLRYEPTIGIGDSLPSSFGAFNELYDIQEEDGVEVDNDEVDQLAETGEDVMAEKVMVDYLDWRDFYMFPAKARTWDEVQAVGKKVYMSKYQARERFGDEIGEEMRADTSPSGTDRSRNPYRDTMNLNDTEQRDIVVYEIWNKTDKRVYWISTGYEYLCDVKDDPLGLKKFFPCPPPINSTLTNDTVQPVADYMEWQDQALQIDELTQRLALLTKACKIAGTYDASNGALKRLLDESVENQLIPVDSWAMYSDKGGVPGGISFLPLKDIQACIETLTEVRKEVKIDLDEVTGLSDVLRGTTDSRETLGGLRLKNNNAGTRLNERQNEVAMFAKEIVRIIAEIMSIHFDRDTLVETSGILFEESMQPDMILDEYRSDITTKLNNDPRTKLLLQQMTQQAQQPPQQPGMPAQAPGGNNVVPFPGGQPPPQQPPQQPQQPPPDPNKMMQQFIDHQMMQVNPQQLIDDKIDKAVELIRADLHKNYRIDIEVDSTIYSDQLQERQDATEFLTATTGFMEKAAEVGGQVPEAIPLLAKSFQWTMRKFRVGRELESSLDIFVEDMIKKSKQLIANPPPSIELQKIQAESASEEKKIQMQAETDNKQIMLKHQTDMQASQAEAEQTKQQTAMEMQQAQMDLGIKKQEGQLKIQIATMQMELEKMKIQLEAQSLQQKAHFDQQQASVDMSMKEQEHQHTMEEGSVQHQHTMQEGAVQHEHSMKEGAMSHKQATDAHGQKKELADTTHKHKMQAAKVSPKKKAS